MVKLVNSLKILWLAIFFAQPASARWSTFENAPLHIKRHDISVSIAKDGSWKLKGYLELKINTASGRLAMAAYKLPLGDENEEMKILSAEILEPTVTRTVPLSSIVLRDVEGTAPRLRPPFYGVRAYTIPFGDLPVGTITRISYESSLKRPRVPGLFSMTFDWGLEYPQFAGSITLAAMDPLYLDVSRAGRAALSFQKGRQAGGITVWRADLKTPLYAKPDGEVGGILSTASVARLQVANKVGWSSITDTLAPRYQALASEALPGEFQKIVEKAKTLPKTEDRLNLVIDMLNAFVSYHREWSHIDGGYVPLRLSSLVQIKRGDSKDFALATTAILRALGYSADVALVWQQAPTEKLWIEETPTTPSLLLFNHAIVRLNEQGRIRYFDPSNPVPFSEGHLSDVAGSWALALTKNAQAFGRVPVDSSIPSNIKIVQNLDLRPDASIVGSGTVHVEGPLAAELKQVYQAQGATQIEPYLRSLFGFAPQVETVNPMIRVSSQDTRGSIFDLSFSYLAPGAIRAPSGNPAVYREYDMLTPGLSRVPLLAAKDRATDVMLSRGLTFDIETKVVGGDVTDEANTSCLALTSFGSLVRETKALNGSFIQRDLLQFKSDRIPAATMRTAVAQAEIAAYGNCLAQTRASIGSRPAYEKSPLGLSAAEAAVLKKPIAALTLPDVKFLADIATPQLSRLVSTKMWLATREMQRRGSRTPQVNLEYTDALLKTGYVRDVASDGKDGPQDDAAEIFLPMHVGEAAKLFATVSGQTKVAKFHRVHATMLLATDRPKEALIALQNAIALEPAQARDSILAASIYSRMGNPAKAEEALKLATNQQGSKSMRLEAIQNLAALRLRAGRTNDFIALYKQALAEAPTNAWIYHDFARQLQSIKMLDLSIEQSRKALSIVRFPEAEATIARTLIMKAEGYYYSAPGIPTIDPQALDMADKLALECLKYSRTESLAYRIAGHAAFLKAMSGDYGSLIATQAYFSKAVELGVSDSWVRERLNAANQALASTRPLAQVWSTMPASKATRLPAAGGNGSLTPIAPTSPASSPRTK